SSSFCMCFFVQTNHTRKELLFLMFKEINLRNHSSLHKIFYSLYDREKDVIYVNKGIYTHQIVKSHLKSSYFVAKDMRGILWHEYGYKLHWDAVKSFYKVHKSKYNDIY
ncbi:hypothetical protein ACTVPD_07835, partial [Lactobacillus crispatus]